MNIELLQSAWLRFNVPLALSAASTSTLLAEGPTYPGSSEIAVVSLDVSKPVLSVVDAEHPVLKSLGSL